MEQILINNKLLGTGCRRAPQICQSRSRTCTTSCTLFF